MSLELLSAAHLHNEGTSGVPAGVNNNGNNENTPATEAIMKVRKYAWLSAASKLPLGQRLSRNHWAVSVPERHQDEQDGLLMDMPTKHEGCPPTQRECRHKRLVCRRTPELD